MTMSVVTAPLSVIAAKQKAVQAFHLRSPLLPNRSATGPRRRVVLLGPARSAANIPAGPP